MKQTGELVDDGLEVVAAAERYSNEKFRSTRRSEERPRQASFEGRARVRTPPGTGPRTARPKGVPPTKRTPHATRDLERRHHLRPRARAGRLYPASREDDIDFDWLDKRSMDPVGYKRINKRTGKEIDKRNIVRGVKQGDGEYVVLSDDEIRNAYPKTTQTIEIEAFVQARRSRSSLEKPYFLEPERQGREGVRLAARGDARAGVIGIARFVMHTKEHLAALIPTGPALMLNTLRWATRSAPEKLDLPAAGKARRLKEGELKMASQLISEMTGPGSPKHYRRQLHRAVHALIARKVKAGKTETVTRSRKRREPSNVIDLIAVLKESLSKDKAPAKKAAKKKAARKKRAA